MNQCTKWVLNWQQHTQASNTLLHQWTLQQNIKLGIWSNLLGESCEKVATSEEFKNEVKLAFRLKCWTKCTINKNNSIFLHLLMRIVHTCTHILNCNNISTESLDWSRRNLQDTCNQILANLAQNETVKNIHTQKKKQTKKTLTTHVQQ